MQESKPSSRIDNIAHKLLIGAIGGFVAGAAVGGIGGRIAMRIIGMMTEERSATLFTDNGNRLGRITLSGTLELAFFIALTGIFVGLMYMALRDWLPGTHPLHHGMGFGLLMLAVFGSLIIQGDSRDFRLFGNKVVNVLLFVALFPLFGLVLAFTAAHLERLRFLQPVGLAISLGIIVVFGLLYLTLLGTGIENLINPDVGDPPRHEQIPSVFLLLCIPLGFVITAAHENGLRWSRQSIRLLYGAVTLAAGMGIYLTAGSLSELF